MQSNIKKKQDVSSLDEISKTFEHFSQYLKYGGSQNPIDFDTIFKKEEPEVLVKIKNFFDLSKLGKITNFATTKLNDKHLLALIGGNLIHLFAIDVPTQEKLERFQEKENRQIPCSMYFIETVRIELRQSSSEYPLQKSEFYFPPQGIPTPVEELLVCDFTFFTKEKNIRGQGRGTELVLASAGSSGIIHLLNFDENLSVSSLKGHTNEILDLKFCPPCKLPNFGSLLLSSSKDSSIRLWNIKLRIRIACFRPNSNPHTDVVSLDWMSNPNFFTSIATDSTVKVWIIPNEVFEWNQSIDKDSIMIDEKEIKKARKKFKYDTPLLSTKDMLEEDSSLANCIQSGSYYIISKDLTGKIVVGMPLLKENSIILLYELKVNMAKLSWDYKMFLHKIEEILVIGGNNGKIHAVCMNRIKNQRITDKKIEWILQLDTDQMVHKVLLTEDAGLIIALTEDKNLWLHNFLISESEKLLK